MHILHGENTVQSRNQLFTYISRAKENGKQILNLDAKVLDLPSLEQALGNESLFGEEKLLIITELHTLPKSKKKDELIDMLAKSAQQNTDQPGSTDIILWEKRDLTPTMLKKFPGAKAEYFKLSSSLFVWLDSLTGQKIPAQIKKSLELLQRAEQNDGDFMCFSMLIRQIRLLLQAKEGNVVGLPPFMIGKLKSQSNSFTLTQLLGIHHKLLTIDLNQKTSQSRLNLSQELELLTTNM